MKTESRRMGNCVTTFNRHSATREAHEGYEIDPIEMQVVNSEMNIDSIIGANEEVTTAIEAHR